MGGETPRFAIPFPAGTDAVRDGDDYMEALAQRVDDVLGVVHSARVAKTVAWNDAGVSGWVEVVDSTASLVVGPPGALCFVRAIGDIADYLGVGYIGQRIGFDDVSASVVYDQGIVAPRSSLVSTQWAYMAEGTYALSTHVSAFNAFTFDINSVTWQVYALGAGISLT
jgi:hypothetical protein